MFKVFNTKTGEIEKVEKIDLKVHVHNSGTPFSDEAIASLEAEGAIVKAAKAPKE